MIFTVLKTLAGKAMSLNGNGLMYLVLGALVITLTTSGVGKLTNSLGFTKSKEDLRLEITQLEKDLELAVHANETLIERLKKEELSSKIDTEAINEINTNTILTYKRKQDVENKRIEDVSSLIGSHNSVVTVTKKSNNQRVSKPSQIVTDNVNNTSLDSPTYQEKIIAKLAKQIEVNSVTDLGVEIITIDKEKMQKVSFININSIWKTYSSLNMETTTSV